MPLKLRLWRIRQPRLAMLALRTMQRPDWLSHAQTNLQVDDIQLFWLDLAQPASAVSDALAHLPAAEVFKIGQLLRPISQRNRTLCQAGLRWLLADCLKVPQEWLQFQWSVNGKPSLVSQPLHFSLAHSRDVGVIAITQRGPVGVDVEWQNPARDVLVFAKHMFKAAEYTKLCDARPNERARLFYAMWTAKEAVVKAADGDLACGLPDLASVNTGAGLSVAPLAAPDGYCAALAQNRPLVL